MAWEGYDFEGTDRFRLVRQIGEGGMGVVYEAEDLQRGLRVALKTIKRRDVETIYRLKREFRALADLTHTNLVHLYDLFVEDDRCFFTMELVEGDSFIRYCQGDERKLRAALPQLAQGLHALHGAGKVHRDIKPSNVLVDGDGRVVLLDFGLVADLGRTDDSLAGHIVGTVEYMAPEQAAADALSPAADWYGIGVLIYEALTGRVPFSGSVMEVLLGKQDHPPAPPRAIDPDVPEDLDALCVDLLAREPQRRPKGSDVLRRLGVDPAGQARALGTITSLTELVPFAGRERELGLLAACADRVVAGEPAVCVVRGQSGMGKSALVHRFLDQRAMEDPRLVRLHGRCYEREAVPYRAMDGVIDDLARWWSGLPRDEQAALVPAHGALLPRLFPVLGRVPALAAQTPPATALPPQELRTLAFGALRDVLDRISRDRTLVVFLDDLQWVDRDSVTLLADVVRPPDSPRMLLLLSTRFEVQRDARGDLTASLSIVATTEPSALDYVAQLEQLLHGIGIEPTTIDLVPLSRPEAIELAERVLHGTARVHAARVAQEAMGIPFFVGELARYVELLGDEQPGPLRLDQVLLERVGRLPERVQRVLETVTIAGEPVSSRVLASALDVPQEELARDVRYLRTAHLLRTPGGRNTDAIESYHDRIRESVRANMSPGRRRELQRGLAIALEQWNQGSPEQLARHWYGAGDKARAAACARRAADAAAEKVDFDRAARLYRMSLELGDHAPDEGLALRTALADALNNAGRPVDAAEAYREAARHADAAQQLELRRQSAIALLQGGYVDQGLEELREVLDHVGLRLTKTPSGALASLLWRRSLLRVRGTRWRQRTESEIARRKLIECDVCASVAVALAVVDNVRGADYQARHLLQALRLGEPSRVARAIAVEASYLAAQGVAKRALALANKAEQVAETVHDDYPVPFCAWARGAVHYFSENDFAAALPHFERAVAVFRSYHMTRGWELDTALFYVLLTKAYLGQIRELARRVPREARAAERRGDLYSSVNLRTRLNIAWLARDDVEAAERELEDALASWIPATRGFHVQHFLGMVAQVDLALYRARPDQAVAVVKRGWRPMVRSLLLRLPLIAAEANDFAARAYVAQAAVDAAAGRELDSREWLSEADRVLRRMERSKMPVARVQAIVGRAGMCAVRGDREAGAALLRRAIERHDALHLRLHAAAARYRLGHVLGGDEGARLVADAAAWMAEEHIANPEAMARVFTPGWG